MNRRKEHHEVADGDERAARTRARYEARIDDALDLLESRGGTDLKLIDLADAAGMSAFHFHRIFRAMTGEAVGDVVRRYRIAGGLRLLRETDRSITDIALEVGYETPQAFSRAFRAVTGTTPSRARLDGTAATALLARFYRPRIVQLEEIPMSDVKIITVEPIKVIAKRHVGPYMAVGDTYNALFAWAGANGLQPRPSGIYGISHDDPDEVPAQDLRYDACLDLGPEAEPGEGLTKMTIGGGEHALIVHKGPYEKLVQTYRALYGRWLPSSGREPADRPPFEHCLNHPDDTPPEELLTEVYLPLKPAAEASS